MTWNWFKERPSFQLNRRRLLRAYAVLDVLNYATTLTLNCPPAGSLSQSLCSTNTSFGCAACAQWPFVCFKTVVAKEALWFLSHSTLEGCLCPFLSRFSFLTPQKIHVYLDVICRSWLYFITARCIVFLPAMVHIISLSVGSQRSCRRRQCCHSSATS